MGFDVSYHPISPAQMDEWYVKALADPAHATAVAEAAGIDPFYIDKYMNVLETGRAVEADASFDSTHGFFMAVIQGFFGRFHYVRGGALSWMDDAIAPYVQDWTEIVPDALTDRPRAGRITQNYMSGVYIPAEKVETLMADLQAGGAFSAKAAEIFPGEHMDILMSALAEARQLGTGLLEATEVVEPNPMDLNNSTCFSNLFNCDTAGPLLYEKTAMSQLEAMKEQMGIEGDIDPSQISYQKVDHSADTPPEKKPGFFARLFGKK